MKIKIKQSILNEHYVAGLYDEFYIPQKFEYKKNHFLHDFLLYGFDDQTQEFFSYGYIKGEGNYHICKEFSIKYSDFIKSILLAQYNDCWTESLYRVKINENLNQMIEDKDLLNFFVKLLTLDKSNFQGEVIEDNYIAYGRASHAMCPEKGLNASFILFEFLNETHPTTLSNFFVNSSLISINCSVVVILINLSTTIPFSVSPPKISKCTFPLPELLLL